MPKVVKFSDTSGTELRWDYAITVRNEIDTITRFSDVAGTNQIGHTDYDYEPNGLIEKISHRDSTGAVIDEFTYQYNADNQVKQETSTLGPTRNFDYDATHQLISENGSNFNWDANGNPEEAGWVISAGNRLDSDGTWNYEYDDAGNLIRKYTAAGEEWIYQYDVGNHLVQAQHKISGAIDLQVDLKYDVFGNRIEKSVDADGAGPDPATVERHAYENGNAWADFDDNGDLTTRRLYTGGLDSLFARIEYPTPTSVGDVAWYLTDRLGSVRDILDSTGTHQAHFDYNAFGQIIVANDPNNFGDRYGFTAREWDAELGLQYTCARYYDPQIRRFISQDPLGFEAGDTNFYRYVGNNASNATDPTGLFGIELFQQLTGTPIGGHRTPPPEIPPEERFDLLRDFDAMLLERNRRLARGEQVAPLTVGSLPILGGDGEPLTSAQAADVALTEFRQVWHGGLGALGPAGSAWIIADHAFHGTVIAETDVQRQRELDGIIWEGRMGTLFVGLGGIAGMARVSRGAARPRVYRGRGVRTARMPRLRRQPRGRLRELPVLNNRACFPEDHRILASHESVDANVLATIAKHLPLVLAVVSLSATAGIAALYMRRRKTERQDELQQQWIKWTFPGQDHENT